MATKLLGPPRPNLSIKQAAVKGGKSYNRGFFRRWFDQTSWLLGCETAGSLFCFPCLLFNPVGTTAARCSWTTTGVTDMHHLAEKGKRHKASKIHMDSCLKFSTFGRVNIAEELDSSYRLAVRSHNEEVGRNQHLLNRIIDCVKFCGVFELALRGKDESKGSKNAGIFRGLLDLVASLDGV
uniref:Si:ch211-240b21.2 n=1 Tax=Nothobranchius pienaari TaxID=704102 RepID=A0A1A8LWI8_9TELE